MEWAISLILERNDTIEKRLEQMLNFIFAQLSNIEILVIDIDATGQIGNEMTTKINQSKNGFKSNKEEVMALVKEYGQVFELELMFDKSFALIVRTGPSIDLVGRGDKPSKDYVGRFDDVDINLFKPPH